MSTGPAHKIPDSPQVRCLCGLLLKFSIQSPKRSNSLPIRAQARKKSKLRSASRTSYLFFPLNARVPGFPAFELARRGAKVLLAAGDTFRAAAIDQLEMNDDAKVIVITGAGDAFSAGYLRGLTGDLEMTTDEWLGTADPSDTVAPQLTEPIPTTPAQFDAFIRAEVKKFAPVIIASGAKVN